MDGTTERLRAHFNEIGEAEWDRLSESPRARVSFELHRRLLAEWIKPGDAVLEVGAGPGRFTIELARLGAQVTVTDLSSVQLDLNEQHVRYSPVMPWAICAGVCESRNPRDDARRGGHRCCVFVFTVGYPSRAVSIVGQEL